MTPRQYWLGIAKYKKMSLDYNEVLKFPDSTEFSIDWLTNWLTDQPTD